MMSDSKNSNSLDPNIVNPPKRATKGTRWFIPTTFLVIAVIVVLFSSRPLLQAYQSLNQPIHELPSEALATPDYSYTPEYSPVDFEGELEKNRMKWDSKLVTHYRISVDLSEIGTYGEMPWIVEVQEGDIVSIVDAQGQIVLPPDYVSIPVEYKNYFTVPALFSYVEQAYLNELPAIRVEYHPIYGYPETIYVDPWVEPCCMDYNVVVRELQVLP